MCKPQHTVFGETPLSFQFSVFYKLICLQNKVPSKNFGGPEKNNKPNISKRKAIPILPTSSFLTDSQNCRGWKGPPEIIESNPPAKAGSLHHVTQVGVQEGLEYLQRRRLHNPPGQIILSVSNTKVWGNSNIVLLRKHQNKYSRQFLKRKAPFLKRRRSVWTYLSLKKTLGFESCNSLFHCTICQQRPFLKHRRNVASGQVTQAQEHSPVTNQSNVLY